MLYLFEVDSCLKGASHKYHINRHVKPGESLNWNFEYFSAEYNLFFYLLTDAGTSCDLAFDIFDCVSDKITEYCGKHHYHDEFYHKLHLHPAHSSHPAEHVVDDYGHYEDEYHDEEPYYYS